MLYPLILLPLYIYPLTTSTWSAVYTAIAANPNVQFQVIVDPDSGPAGAAPDASYLPALELLKSYSNVQTLGYVHTSWAARAIADVTADIDDYVAWAAYNSAIRVDGIFFDEAVATVSTASVAYMTNITAHARAQLGSAHDYIVYNPGTTVAASWYSLADNIVAYEGTAAGFSASSLSSTIGATNLPKSSFIIYSGPSTAAAQTTLVGSAIAANVGGLMITETDGYTSISPLWSQFCAEMEALA